MFKKILKWTGIGIGSLIAVLLIVNAIFVSRSSAALQRRLQAVRDSGQPLCLADLAHPDIPGDQNAAVYYRRAQQDLQAIDHELREMYQSSNWSSRALSKDELQAIRQTVDSYPNVLTLLEQAAACPVLADMPTSTSVMEFQTGGLEQVQAKRLVARYLTSRCLVLIAEGKQDEAISVCTLSLRLARHLDTEPTLLSLLVAIAARESSIEMANRVLRAGPVSAAARNALNAELAQHDLTQAYRHALATERALGLTSFQEMNVGRWWPARGYWNNAVIYYLDTMDVQLELAARPYYQMLQNQVAEPDKPLSPWTRLTDLVKPAIQAARGATERNRAKLRRCAC